MQKKFAFDKETLVKIGKGTLIAGGGAALTYLIQYLMTVDFGVYTPAVVGLLSIALNSLREYFKGE